MLSTIKDATGCPRFLIELYSFEPMQFPLPTACKEDVAINSDMKRASKLTGFHHNLT